MKHTVSHWGLNAKSFLVGVVLIINSPCFAGYGDTISQIVLRNEDSTKFKVVTSFAPMDFDANYHVIDLSVDSGGKLRIGKDIQVETLNYPDGAPLDLGRSGVEAIAIKKYLENPKHKSSKLLPANFTRILSPPTKNYSKHPSKMNFSHTVKLSADTKYVANLNWSVSSGKQRSGTFTITESKMGDEKKPRFSKEFTFANLNIAYGVDAEHQLFISENRELIIIILGGAWSGFAAFRIGKDVLQ